MNFVLLPFRKYGRYTALLFLLTVLCNYTLVPILPAPVTGNIRYRVGTNYVYYGELHNHTLFSDGSGTPRQAYDYAKNNAEYDFFGLSDHAWQLTEKEWQQTKATADSCNLDHTYVTFRGFEWTSGTYGHCSVFGTEDFCTASDSTTYTFAGLCSWLESRDALAFFNHPNRPYQNAFNMFLDPPTDKFVGMDLWNKDIGFDYHYYNDGLYPDDNGKSHFDEALSRGWHIGAGGSGDNHYASWGTRVDFRIAVLAPALTRNDITEAFIARRFYSTLDKNIVLSFTANGNEMGSVLSSGRVTLTVTVFDGDFEPATDILIYNRNHEVIAQWHRRSHQITSPPPAPVVEIHMRGSDNTPLGAWHPDSGVTTFTHTVSATEGDYFYTKITQQDGDEAISSPVWVSPIGGR